jgi:hypothetical protein
MTSSSRWIQWLFVVAAVVVGSESCSDEESAPGGLAVADAGSSATDQPRPVATTEADAAPPADASEPDAALGNCVGPAGRTLRTLIVGNSQIYFWDLPRVLSELSRSGPPSCPRIDAEGFTRGGQNLKRLWLEGDSLARNLATTIEVGRYDVVVLAESIELVEHAPPYTDFVTFADVIIDAARASGAMPVIYATPYADQPDHWGFSEMAAPQLAFGAARGVRVAAGGLAWLRVWRELPTLDLHHPDHAHPGYNGSVISAMVIYSAITRGTPIGLTPPPARECYRGACVPPITEAEADVFRRAAWDEIRATGPE